MVLLGVNVIHLTTFRPVFRYANITNSVFIIHVVILYFSLRSGRSLLVLTHTEHDQCVFQ